LHPGARQVLLEDLGGVVLRASGNPYPILDQNMWFSLSYFRSDLTQNLIPFFRPDPNPILFALTFEKGFKFPMFIKPQFFGEENY